MKQRCFRGLAVLILTLMMLVSVLPARTAFADDYSREELQIMNQVYDFLVSELNYNAAAACGILANIEKECRYTNYAEEGSGAYGLMQWLGGRKTSMMTYCEEHGYAYDTIEGQLQYVKHEMEEGGDSYKKIHKYMLGVPNTAAGAYDAAYYWCYNYERPTKKESHSKVRGTLAKTVIFPMFRNDRRVFAPITNEDPAAIPQLTSAVNTPEGLLVTWEPVEGADSYRIYRKSGENWAGLVTVTEPSYLDTSVKEGKTYQYTVQSSSESLVSGYDHAGIAQTRLGVPSLKSAVNMAGGISLNWTKTGGAKQYQILRKTEDSPWEIVKELPNTKFNWTDTTAESGVRYTYTVRAASGIYLGYSSEEISICRLAEPALKSLINTETGIELSWEAVAGADGYRIFEKTGKTWSPVADVPGEECLWACPIDVSGTAKSYMVAATNGEDISSTPKSGLSIIYLNPPVLDSVQNVSNGIKITWKSVSKASSYEVLRKEEGSTEWTRVRSAGASVSGHTDTKVRNGVNYTYTVRATKNGSRSAFDESGLSIWCLKAPSMLPVTNTDDQFIVGWNPVDDADGYRVFRSESAKGPWTAMADVTAEESSWVDASIQPGQTYYYTAASLLKGSASPTAPKVTNGTRLTTPVLVSTGNAAKGIRVEWEPVAGAKGYQIYRKTEDSGWTLAGSARPTSSAWVDAKAKAGHSYCYTVRAYSKTANIQCFSKSDPKGIAGLRVPPVKIASVANLTADHGFVCKWKPSTLVSGYEIQYSLNMDMSKAESIQVAVPSTSCSIPGLTAGKKYYIRLRGLITTEAGTTTSSWSSSSLTVR